jgi:hypothetical protein
MAAAKQGESSACHRLLASGANPDQPEEMVRAAPDGRPATTGCKVDRWAPIHFACAHGHEAVVAALLAGGACVSDGKALALAEARGRVQCALLIQLHTSNRAMHTGIARDSSSGEAARASQLLDADAAQAAVTSLEVRWQGRLLTYELERAALISRAAELESLLKKAGRRYSSSGAGRPSCPVCMESPRDTAMVPCGHTACAECAQKLLQRRGNCAECNRTIEQSLRLFGLS